MQTLLFVPQMTTEEAASKIRAALKETRVDFTIKLNEHCVVIEGRNDLVYTAKVALREAGFEVQ